jgi:thioredoxin reductase (NADPH)
MLGGAAMTEPALLVLDDEPDELDALRGTLHRRYGRDYLVICEGSAARASDRLAQLAADGRAVAIVRASAAMIDTGGGEVLAMAHRLYPVAKRVLVVPRGGSSAPSLRVPALLLQDQSVAQPVLRAITLGVVDTYLPSPHGGRDEGFHLAINELLEEWARQRRGPIGRLPGVFAAGDVHQRSVKRVAAAAGEGSVVATQVTQYLQEPIELSRGEASRVRR